MVLQAIGAYNVDVEVDGDQKTICFLDTPGEFWGVGSSNCRWQQCQSDIGSSILLLGGSSLLLLLLMGPNAASPRGSAGSTPCY
jgi:hypothetical protein